VAALGGDPWWTIPACVILCGNQTGFACSGRIPVSHEKRDF